MRKTLVKTGIDIIGDVPWGTHVGQFYRSMADLFEVVIPFIRAGLESGDFCLWLVSDPVSEGDAREAIGGVVPDSERFIAENKLVIAPISDWWPPSTAGNAADDPELVTAKIRGYLNTDQDGVRLAVQHRASGGGWGDFETHRREVDRLAEQIRVVAMCSYPVGAFRADELIGVLRHHQYTIFPEKDGLTVIGGYDFERLWGSLRATESSFRNVISNFADGIVITDFNGTVRYANAAAESLFGKKAEEMLGQPFPFSLVGREPEEVAVVKPNGEQTPAEMRVMETEWEGEAACLATIRDITIRKRAEEALRSLPYRLMQMQENERRAIGRELHDQTGQYLTALKLLLVRAMRQTPEQAALSLNEAQTLANELFTQVRELSLSLRPPMLDDLGLLPALLWLFERYTLQTQIHISFKHAGLERWFAPEVSTAAYRIVQEALTNVARHARVNEVVVRMWTDADALNLRVEDKGIGFDPAALDAPTSTGLNGMRERVMLLGGRFNIDTAPGMGTTISAELPLPVRMGNWSEKERKECQP